jgi:hypothetical protein
LNKKIIYLLFIFNILFVIGFVFLSFRNQNIFQDLETQSLIVREPSTLSSIEMKVENKEAKIFVKNDRGKNKICLIGGENPKIEILGKEEKKLFKIAIQNEEDVELSILDKNEKPKVFLRPEGIYIKNKNEKVIASLVELSEGEGGFGLANNRGIASTILKGGEGTSLTMFSEKNEPAAVFGVIQNVPHLIVSGEIGDEGILLHGGKQSGMMVLDEVGSLKVFICKEGIFQSQEEEKKPKQGKFFSKKVDKDILFPSQDSQIAENKKDQ